MLNNIARVAARDPSLDIHFSIFVTCLCNPEKVPIIPNCDVLVERPAVSQLLKELIASLPFDARSGGIAVCAAGPQSLTREARNAVAGASLMRAGELGQIGCHTEEYAL